MKRQLPVFLVWILCLLSLSTIADINSFVFETSQIRHSKGSFLLAEPSDDRRKRRTPYTIGDLRRDVARNPSQFQAPSTLNKSKSRRTRKRAEHPQQQYLYASQRSRLAPLSPYDAARVNNTAATTVHSDLALAKELGLIPSAQHCDPCPYETPKLVGSLRVQDDDGSSTVLAYIMEKPAGWAVLGSSAKKAVSSSSAATTVASDDAPVSQKPRLAEEDRKRHLKRVSVKNDDGSFGGYMEYNELDVLALLTPEELEEYQDDAISEETSDGTDASSADADQPEDATDARFLQSRSVVRNEEPGDSQENDASDENVVVNEQTRANLQKIAARSIGTSDRASWTAAARPSVISWWKEQQALAGTPIRGGNHWTALAGAVEVDDTGLLLLCPKSHVQNVVVESVEYIAAVGNGGFLNPSPLSSKNKLTMTQDMVQLEVLTKLRRGRSEDIVHTVKAVISDRTSSCSNVVSLCQEQFKDGIRGDPAANPLDRRAPRRLIHCRSMSVLSTTHQDTIVVETEGLPDDIAVLAERRNHLEYKKGSFLGRASLQRNPLTNAYREINGAADGFPGWTVDRYGDWLSVFHDTKHPKGPLPSIHDGNTAGVYYLESNPNRSSMGTETEVRPRLLEGRPAPDMFPIVENGVTYLVSLNRDLSTGIFLDQRLHRGWLRRNCGPDTRILNCFAHTGAFSVAAAAAGASTVSLDLSKKWLNRLPEQLMANGIAFDERHDCIYGDCFDWLTRLAKRNELYDIVILDPPSTSIGQKRKRWSIQDMDELVSLAAGLVKKGGFLWTTTNSASIPASKFARLCRKGLEDAGVLNAKLERIQPMPSDFPSIGTQPVKNFVWRIP